MPIFIALLSLLFASGLTHDVRIMSANVGGSLVHGRVAPMDNGGLPFAKYVVRGRGQHASDNGGGSM